VFLSSGTNLSGGAAAGNAEYNAAHLLHRVYDSLRPADPDVMRAVWSRFDDPPPPPEVAERLWGATARALWDRHQRIARRFGPLRGVAVRTGLVARLARR
jgi:hypothetical protein